MKTLIRLFTALAGGICALAAARHLLRDERRRRALVVRFNKRLLNPVMLRLARGRRVYFSRLHHVGRRSGTAYVTPVVAKRTSAGYVIPLPYGADTDWCRNVLAAGRCEIESAGARVELVEPRIVGAAAALPLVPAVNARVWRRFGIDTYLMLAEAAAQARRPVPVASSARPGVELAPRRAA
jgi:deazaflavin-dependent oxidoreductase (nitroreductase family)